MILGIVIASAGNDVHTLVYLVVDCELVKMYRVHYQIEALGTALNTPFPLPLYTLSSSSSSCQLKVVVGVWKTPLQLYNCHKRLDGQSVNQKHT